MNDLYFYAGYLAAHVVVMAIGVRACRRSKRNSRIAIFAASNGWVSAANALQSAKRADEAAKRAEATEYLMRTISNTPADGPPDVIPFPGRPDLKPWEADSREWDVDPEAGPTISRPVG